MVVRDLWGREIKLIDVLKDLRVIPCPYCGSGIIISTSMAFYPQSLIKSLIGEEIHAYIPEMISLDGKKIGRLRCIVNPHEKNGTPYRPGGWHGTTSRGSYEFELICKKCNNAFHVDVYYDEIDSSRAWRNRRSGGLEAITSE